MNKKKTDENLKNRRFVLISSGIILSSALLLSLTSGLSHIFIICFLGLILSFFVRKPVRYNDRTLIYSLLISVVLAVFFDLVFPMDRNRFVLLGDIFSTNISAPALLYLATAITFFEFHQYGHAFSIAFSLFALMLGSDILPAGAPQQNLLFFPLSQRQFNLCFTTTLLSEIVFLILSLQFAFSGFSKKLPLIRRFIFAAAFGMSAFLGISGYHVFKYYENDFRRLEGYFLKVGMRRFASRNRVIFGREVNLNRTIAFEFEKNRKQILLRARSKTPPGYLRGRVYSKYNSGKWSNPDAAAQKMQFKMQEGLLACNIFYYPEGEKIPNYCFNVYPSVRFFSDVLLVPGNSVRFEMAADRLNSTGDGVLLPEDWQKDGGYTVFTPEPDQESAFPKPSGGWNNGTLSVPDSISGRLDDLLANLKIGTKDGGAVDDRKIIGELTNFFHKNFTYSLTFREDSGDSDPVVRFLTESRKGHCELFASSMVLLLRKCGIPARYVTGFICQEQHPSGEYYVSRLDDAHAWVEAFDRTQGKWTLVEPTPSAGIPNFHHEWGLFDSATDGFKHYFQIILADLRRGYFAEAIIAVFKGFFGFLKSVFWNPSGMILFLPLAVLLYLYKKIRKRNNQMTSQLSAPVAALRKEYLGLEAFIFRKRKVQRPKNRTISEWIGEFDKKDRMLANFAELAAVYQNLRYREKIPDKTELNDYQSKARAFVKN